MSLRRPQDVPPRTQDEILKEMHRLEIMHQQLHAQLDAVPPMQPLLPAHISNEIGWQGMPEYGAPSVAYFTRGPPLHPHLPGR
jgi:hypothetical protein